MFQFLKRTKGNNKKPVSTYQAIRYSATGVFGYEFIDDNGEIISTVSSIVAPNASVYLSGFGYNFVSNLNTGGMNTSRIIEDSEGRTIAYLQQKGQNRYSLNFYNMEMEIVIDEMLYNFSISNSLIASMYRNRKPYVGENNEYYDKEKMFDITIYQELEPFVLLGVFSTPSLVIS